MLVLTVVLTAFVWWHFAARSHRYPSTERIIQAAVLELVFCTVVGLAAFKQRSKLLLGLLAFDLLVAVLQSFSTAYWDYGTASNFNRPLTHLDAAYFAVGTFTTAGTGTVSAISETARRIQTVQMLVDFTAIGIVLALVIAAISAHLSREPG